MESDIGHKNTNRQNGPRNHCDLCTNPTDVVYVVDNYILCPQCAVAYNVGKDKMKAKRKGWILRI